MTDSVNMRELVLALLLEITRDGEYSHIAIQNVLGKYQYLEKRERAFITRVTEGTLERMIELDYVIDQYSRVKVQKMKPVIRCILRSAVYELKYMDAVPQSATCNEAVKLAKKKGFGSLAGFVNGVLRNIGRNLSDISYPDEEKEPIKSLSVRYSTPEWMIEQWISEYGREKTEEILRAFLEKTGISIRTNLVKNSPKELRKSLEAEGIAVRENREIPYAFYIEGVDYLQALKSFQDGLFYVQDASSMKAVIEAAPKEGDYVIDVCAAPGGKSVHIAELMHGTGHVQARDLTEYKIGLIEQNQKRCGISNLSTLQWDARIRDASAVEKADIVIADLPCSGLGVMRKKKDIRFKMTPEKQRQLAALQREILHTVSEYVKPGGKLVYSTCTISRKENEDNALWFVENHPQFALERMEQILPADGACDGFFIAGLRKNK